MKHPPPALTIDGTTASSKMPRPSRAQRSPSRWAASVTAAVLAAGGLAVVAAPAAWAEPPAAIPEKATVGDLKWAPAMDYDGDGCYPTPAIDANASPAVGLELGGGLGENCSDLSDLENTNAYVRTWCQPAEQGPDRWCAHKYAYYFEKDQVSDGAGPGTAGHKNDLEHVVVWVRDDQVQYVAASGHGGYEIKDAADVQFDGTTHPKIVYNKDGGSTHRMRFASPADDPPENQLHTWQYPTLLSWELMDPHVRDVLATNSYGSASLALKDSVYASDLEKAKKVDPPWDFDAPLPSTDPPADPPADDPRPPGNPDALLRVMPLGSSTTAGNGSSTGNGYRDYLRQELSFSPQDDLVGSNLAGTMDDRDNEGWPGYRIDEIAGKAVCAVRAYQPNVITVLAGGNDIIQDYQVADAPFRLQKLINQLISDDDGVTVVVGAIQPVTSTPAATQRAAAYNRSQEAVVNKMADSGLKVVWAPNALTTGDIGPDSIHPGDDGYRKVAVGFADAIKKARNDLLVSDPNNQQANFASHPCGSQDYGGGDDGNSDSGTDQGVVDRRWEDHGVSFADGLGKGNTYRWGDVNKDGKPELFVVQPNQAWTFYWNAGRTDKGWNGWTKGVSRPARATGLNGGQLYIADIDGDGEPDCLQTGPKGFVDAFLWDETKPVGQKLCGKTSTQQHDVPNTGSVGAAADTQIVFADVNGDGKDDYLLVQPRGTTWLWLNSSKPDPNAKGKTVFAWVRVGQIAAPTDPARVRRWADIDGDGRADMILITAKGGARAWLNDGITRSAAGAPTGVALRDIGQIASDKNVPPDDVQFVDVGGNGNADFVRTGWTGVTHIWLNRLNGGDLV